MTKLKHLLFTIIFLLLGNISSGQTDTLIKQNSLLNELRNADRVESEYVGFVGARSEIYQTAKYLWNITSIDMLVKLTDDKSPIVRCYAFLGLIEKNTDKKIVKDIADKHKNDSIKITTMNGCIVTEYETVRSYIKSQTQWYCMDESQKEQQRQKQKQELDSILNSNKKEK